MGILGGFGSSRYSARDAYNDEEDSNYRRRAFENTKSNNGWFECPRCGRKCRKRDMDVDHIVPKSMGGGNTRENLQCLCYHCNRSKQDDTSDTRSDLARRRKELREQDRADREFVRRAMKYKDDV